MNKKFETVRISLPPKILSVPTIVTQSWIRGKSNGGVEERLQQDFSDTLGNTTHPKGGIIAGLRDNLVIGVPYDISDGRLRIGPYTKHDSAQIPGEIYVPLENILAYNRFELPKQIRLGGIGFRIKV